MALSNWDTLAVDENGAATKGVLESPMGVVVEFYKNWIYVSDKKAWREGGGFCKPVVAQVNAGHLDYQDVHIVAKRGPQNGIYAAVWVGWKDIKAMVGIGCYGYDDDSEWVGVQPESIQFLEDMIKSEDENHYVDDKLRSIKFDKALRFNQGDAYFAKHVDHAPPATVPGAAQEPVLTQLLK